MKNRITELFGIEYPIVQGGMVWASGWRLASAVSNAGGLGLLGSGSMEPEVLREHIVKCKKATYKPFGVNVPIMFETSTEAMRIIMEEEVPIVFTSAGNPAKWTKTLKDAGIKVVHVVSSSKFALKSEDAGVDAVVTEGFEAGGHNGREETTTLTLIPLVSSSVKIPVIAAGGIGGGKAMLAAMILGAEGVQMGSRFVATDEAGVHQNFKQMVVDSKEGDTMLTLKEIAPVRMLKNDFYKRVEAVYNSGAATFEKLSEVLGRGRAKSGMFDGDLTEGELEIGQVAASIDKIMPAGEVIKQVMREYTEEKKRVSSLF